jgi:protein involved in polysaccharide export with SLBB domain
MEPAFPLKDDLLLNTAGFVRVPLLLIANARRVARSRFARMASMWRRWPQSFAACAMLLMAAMASAQTPTPEQIEMFRNLPPEQQQAILQAIGAGSGASGSTSSGVARDKSVTSPETVRPRDVSGEGDQSGTGSPLYPSSPYSISPYGAYSSPYSTQNSNAPREMVIRGRDTVLIDLRIEQPVSTVTPTPGEATSATGGSTTTANRLDRVTGPRTADQTMRLEAMRDRILRGNPYKLDDYGVLRIAGVAPIPLAGLTEKQATERLNLDPALLDFELNLRLLPLQKLDFEALKPFGYDLFAGTPSTFAPVTDIPVPTEYVIGPGDRFEVQLFGNSKGRYSLVVNRDGRIMFPELGPIAVSGLKFDEARSRIEARVAEQMIGTQAVIAMGDLRSIRVFVLGEAQRPGSYTVSGLSTITNALFVSGGVRLIGSLRNIQLKRNGRLVKRLDLYDMLLKGDTSDNVRLLPGDVIFIPPVGTTAGIMGEVRRPAIYELSGESTAADLLFLAGGMTPRADPKLARIDRIDARRDHAVIDVDLSSAQARSTVLQAGDVLEVPAALPTFANSVEVKGHVYRPGGRQFRGGMRLSQVLPSVDELKPNADLHYVLIRREPDNSRRIETVSADLTKAWQAPGSPSDPVLAARDQIYVFDLETGRKQYLDPIINDLKRQAVSTAPSRVVRVVGGVRADGEYPLDPGMRISDLIRAGGGLAEQAYGSEAELARYEMRDGQTRQTEVVKVDLAQALAGDPTANVLLSPFDTLVVKQVSEWSQQNVVRLEGEVRFPGDYPIARGETLRSVITRAGGLTTLAFPEGAVFTRELLKERERQQIKILTDRLRQDLGTLALQSTQGGGLAGAQATETLSIGQSLLADLQAAEPVGRLVIDLDHVMAAEPGSTGDLILRNGDRLRVPKQMQEVTVIGEVQNAISHLFTPGLSRDDYVRMSGGATQRADEKRIYVVHANGSVETEHSSWFASSGDIHPGDTIVVPLDAERMRPLPLWTSVTTIIYNLAVAVAAIGSL